MRRSMVPSAWRVSFDRLGESDAVTYAMLVRFAIPPPSRQSFALIAHRGFPPASTRLVDVFVADGWLKFVGRKEDGRGWFDPQEFHFGWVYANRWTHVASVYDAKGNRRSHYVNGRPVYSETNDLHFSRVEIGPACIGNHTNQDGKPIGDVALQGLVDDVRIYERALTEPEIRTLANSRFE